MCGSSSIPPDRAPFVEFAGEDRRGIFVEAFPEIESGIEQFFPAQVDQFKQRFQRRVVLWGVVFRGVATFFQRLFQENEIVIVAQKFAQHVEILGKFFHQIGRASCRERVSKQV